MQSHQNLQRLKSQQNPQKLSYRQTCLTDFLSLIAQGKNTSGEMHQLTGFKADHSKIHKKLIIDDQVALVLPDHLTELHLQGSTDIFMSPQTFADWRCTERLRSIRAWYVDIDTLGHKNLSCDSEDIRKEVFDCIYKAKLPIPSAIVQSGSGGLHLYWFTEKNADSHSKKLWLSVAKFLTNNISKHRPSDAKWEVDVGAAHDIVRLLRLPGSIHWKSQNRVVAEICNDAKKHHYSFDFMCKWAGVEIERPQYQKSFPGFGKQKEKAHTGHTLGQYHARIFWHLANYTRSGQVVEKQRDWVLHLMLCSLLQLRRGDKEAAMNEIRNLNEHVGLSERELDTYMSTTLAKQYVYSLAKLNRILSSIGIPQLASKKKKPLSDTEVKQRQSEGALVAAENKRNASLEKITDTLISRASVTQREVSEITGLSIATVKRHWSKALEALETTDKDTVNDEVSAFEKGIISSPSYISPTPDDLFILYKDLNSLYRVPYLTEFNRLYVTEGVGGFEPSPLLTPDEN